MFNGWTRESHLTIHGGGGVNYGKFPQNYGLWDCPNLHV